MSTCSAITVAATIEGLATALDLLDEALESRDLDMKMALEIHLVVEEALVNVVSYSGAKNMTLTLEGSSDRLMLTISDDGVPFDPLAIPPPDIDAGLDDRVPGGLGIFLIREKMDEVSYEYRDSRNILRMVKGR